MTRRPIDRPGCFVLLLIVGAMASGKAEAQGSKPFPLPKDRAAWDSRREALRGQVDESLSRGLPARPKDVRLEAKGRESRPGPTIEPFAIDDASGKIGGVLVLPEGAGESRRVPLVLLVRDPARPSKGAIEEPGFDGRPPAATLAGFGFATLAIDPNPAEGPHLRDLRIALGAALARPEFDADRVAVVGIGPAGLVALRLMAIDERVDCGVVAVESRDLLPSSRTRFEELAALCAPRPLSLMVGEALPSLANSPAKAIERAVKGTYKVYGPEGTGLAMNIYGEFPGHDSVATRLQWMAGLEQLDKHLRPQGPTPLDHAPETEPEADGRFVDLAERGIAGWSAEMSQRPGTWTWLDGVITCKPLGPNEFGWLRLPIEVDDFILKVEWRVPDKGNGGIFLRAKPVTWALPPGDLSKPRLQALGLEWPSRTGLELQAQADPGDANRYSSGSLYRHAAPAANPTRVPGQWNRYTVRARGPRIEVWSNRRQVLDTSLDRYPETLPNPPLRGYIGLQNHGSPAEYRNLKLLRLRD